jgi:hypothetical protein
MLKTRDPLPEISHLPEIWQSAFTRPLLLTVEPRRNGASAVIRVMQTLPVMVGTIIVKIAQGARFRFCKARDCKRPFELLTKHPRMFCSRYCAHLEALRRKRGTRQIRARRGGS